MEFNTLGFGVLRFGARFFLALDDIVHGLGRICFFARFFGRQFFVHRTPADNCKFEPVYGNDTEKQNEQGIKRAPALHGKKIHAVILPLACCHKIRNRRIFSEIFGKNQTHGNIIFIP